MLMFKSQNSGQYRLTLASIVLALCLTSIIIPAYADGDHPWCYEDDKCAPKHWGGVCKTGHSQSPIDLRPDRVIHGRKLQQLKINQKYREIQPRFYIKNNGHTIQIQLDEEMTSSLKVVGDGLPGRYQFSQMHFHWGSEDHLGSEHTVGGTSYAMELHLVHFAERYENILAAISDRNSRALAVFGIFFTVTKMDNPALNPITEAIQHVRNFHPDPYLIDTPTLNISAFFPDVLNLFRYDGSLTTPSCLEKVVWTVFRQPVPISKRQLNAFRSSFDSLKRPLINNFRPTQPISPRRRVIEGTVRLGELRQDEDDVQNEINVDGSTDRDLEEDVTDKSATHKSHKHVSETHEHDDEDESFEDDDEHKKNGSSSLNFNSCFALQFVFSLIPTSITVVNYVRTSLSFKMFEPI